MAAKGGGGGGGAAGTLKSTSINGVKVYSITGRNYVAPWVLAKTKRSLRKDTGTRPIKSSILFGCLLMCCNRFTDLWLCCCFFGCRVPAEAGVDP